MAIEVIYNGESLPNIYGDMFFSQNYHKIIFKCYFLIAEDSVNSLMAKEEQLRNAIREPLKNISAKYDGSAQFILSHSSNDALNPFTSISKVLDSEYNTEISRAYIFEYSAELPADIDGHNFRRYTESSFSISETATGIQKVNFKLKYTAGLASSSLENFESFAVSYASSVLLSIDNTKTFELIGRNFTTDDEKKITVGDLNFIQIVENELDGILNSPLIRKASVDYKIFLAEMKTISHTVGVDGTPWNRIQVMYNCEIEEGSFPNKSEVELFYRNSIKPFLIKRGKEILNVNAKENSSDVTFMHSDEFSFVPNSNRLNASFSLMSPFDNSNVIISVREELLFLNDSGRLFSKVWDGRDDTFAVYERGKISSISRAVSIQQIGSRPNFPAGLENFLGDTYIRKTDSERFMPTISYGKQSVPFSNELQEIIVFESVFQDSYIKVDEVVNLFGGA